MDTIMQLPRKINTLSKDKQKLFQRFFELDSYKGSLVIPDSFTPKVLQYFGRRYEDGQIREWQDDVIDRLTIQRILRIRNKHTNEEVLFNELRASRPGQRRDQIQKEKAKITEHIQDALDKCDFCEPLKYTSHHGFPRIRKPHCITGANIAKYDAWSGMVYFKRHNPLTFTEDELSDVIDASFEWFDKVHKSDRAFKYPFFMWNCLEKAGASQVHGHAQVLMAKGRPYAKVASLIDVAKKYKGKKGYFNDLWSVHRSVGLGHDSKDVKAFVYLTPVKEKETFLFSEKSSPVHRYFKSIIFNTLRCMIDTLGVTSFNMVILMEGLGQKGKIPCVVRIVDRGSILKKTGDMGGMELYGTTVIASDPYLVSNALSGVFQST